MSAPRPLSPHIQIYSLFTRFTSLTSILHRLTGLALVAGSVLIVAWLMAIAHGPEAYAQFMTYTKHPLGQFVLIGFTWAFWYQLLNGVRHLVWDAGFGFKLQNARATAYTVIGLSFVATAATWFYLCMGV